MPRRRRDQDDDKDSLLAGLINGAVGLLFIWFLYVGLLYMTDRPRFWLFATLTGVFIVAAGLVVIVSLVIHEGRHRRHLEELIAHIRKANQETEVENFIRRWGRERGQGLGYWSFRGYVFERSRLNDFLDNLTFKKGIRINERWLLILLEHYIQGMEARLTIESVAAKAQDFSSLSGMDFEHLLARLYEAMGYATQLTGRAGDQGGDLIANKSGERVLIQAKRYGYPVGNKAVQEAIGAKGYYDCSRATVVSTSVFTRQAVDLAKANGVELIPRATLQRLLMQYLKESWN